MLLSALRPSQRGVVEKQLRKNVVALFAAGSPAEVMLGEAFFAGQLDLLLEDTECQIAPDGEEEARLWWADEVARRLAVKEWNESVTAFADREAERLGVEAYSVKATYTPQLARLAAVLVLQEEDLSGSEQGSEDEDDTAEESEEEDSEEEEDDDDVEEDAHELGIKRKRVE